MSSKRNTTPDFRCPIAQGSAPLYATLLRHCRKINQNLD